MPISREIELKGTIRPEHLDQVKDHPAIEKRTVGRSRPRNIATVYFDTPDHALRLEGLCLRVRKVGRAYMQCVKQVHNGLGGIQLWMGCEGAVPSQDPAIAAIKDKKLRRLIRRVGVERLQPVFRTYVQRSSRKLKFEDGSTISLDIDVGEIAAGDVSEPICEFELEVEGGASERLLDLASEIGKVVPFQLVTRSKAARGYALLTHEEPQPQKYVNLSLAKGNTVEQVLTELVQHCLDHLRTNEAVVLTTDNLEGVHQMRVALRRLRAGLRLFRPSLPNDQYGWVVAEAKWLTAELSAAREWDVFAEEFLAPVAGLYQEERGFDSLAAVVGQARQQSRQRARDAIRTKRYLEFLLHLSAWRSGQAWRNQPVSERTIRLLDPIGEHCVRLLNKRHRDVRKQGQDIAELPEAGLHDLRLAIKRLRYTADFFEGLYPRKKVNAYRKHLVVLQDQLGYLNDVAAVERLLRELAGAGRDQAPTAWVYAGGVTVGWHHHAAIVAKQRLGKDMAAFLRIEPFWREA